MWLKNEINNLSNILDKQSFDTLLKIHKQIGSGEPLKMEKIPNYLKPMHPLQKIILKTMYKISPERTKRYLKIKRKSTSPLPQLPQQQENTPTIPKTSLM
jgi:hypothetical protein